MLKNYFKVAFRNLSKKKLYSFINIAGLTVGITCCILIALYVQHELSFDNFQQKGDRIVRVIMEYSTGGTIEKGNFTSTKVAPSFQRNFPEIEAAVRMTETARIVKYEDKLFDEKNFMYADSTFFDMFSFPLLKGNAKYALPGPNNVVLTQSTAKKYFGDEDPIGKILKIGSSETDYTVRGVIQDCPTNSQIQFDFLASFSSLGVTQEETYWDANYTTYLLLKDKSSITSLQSKIAPFMRKEMQSEVSDNDYVTYDLEPFKTIHLYSPYDAFVPNNSITYIYILSAIALLILLIACFTYINLSTARSMERAKEVGIRKVSGAMKKQIFFQFIAEYFVLSLIALLISVVMTALLLPAFNQLAQRELTITSLFSPYIISFIVFIIICISFFAGSYPALILSGLQPVKVLKGAFKNSGSGLWVRKTLIVFQFVISVLLIISTFIIQTQLHYLQSKKLGYDRDHIIVLPTDQKILANLSTFKSEFKSNPNVSSVARTSNEPINILSGYTMRSAEMPDQQQVFVNGDVVDEEFIKTIGAKIVAGSDFTGQDIKDVTDNTDDKRTYHFILNEAAAKELGWTPEEAIGKKIFLGDQRPGIVKAVIQDFNFSSLHNPIRPLILFPEEWSNYMLVKISGQDMANTISFMQAKWKTLASNRPFEYHFLDEDYTRLYSTEMRFGNVLNIFAAIAILLAALGLVGLSAYAIQQRTKEIGIRKVLGATPAAIAALISNEFVKLVLIAFVIATPIAWWSMNRWLQGFAYRIEFQWWVFVITAIVAIIIVMITVSLQALKAAFANPVKSLRME